MNLYTEGEFDPVLAQKELGAAAGVTSDTVARRDIARIQAAALIDIAGSLKVLSLEALLAMGQLDEPGGYDDDTEADGFDEPLDLTRADAGTLVRIIREPAAYGVLTGEGGVDQGEPWVGVNWESTGLETPLGTRVFVTELEAIPTDEVPPIPGAPLGAIVELEDGTVLGDGVTPPTLPEYVPPAVADLAEDLDDDFDGDEHKAAEDALAALKAREAERKAAKKKAAKK
jgi:hypothetical protein